VRHFLRLLLFFVSLLPLVAQDELSSTWWYPLGNPQGTLRNPAATKSQQAEDLVIKWRAPQMANSPTTLVGGLRTIPPGRRQQVVGAHLDTLFILSDLGVLERRVSYRDQGLTNAFMLTPTGLFNLASATPSVNARGLPNRIGIGVERRQRNSPGDPDPLPLVAFLADSSGRPSEEIRIDPLPDDPDLNNQSAGIYPVAAYSSSVLVAISQNMLQPTAGGPLANSLRKYDITGRSPKLRWSYPVAPRTYAQHPALLADPASPEVQRIALSTSSYPHDVHLRVDPPQSAPVFGRSTWTDTMYSVQILDDGETQPVHVNTFPVPLTSPFNDYRGDARSYFITLSESPGSEENFLLITENHSAERPGRPHAWLTSATPGSAGRDSIYAEFIPQKLPRNDLGLTIVAADVDRGAPDRTIVDGGFSYYVNNPGDELLLAYEAPDGTELAENYLYVLRRRAADLGSFDPFIQYRFSGRLMGAGDLVAGDPAREEVVIAYGNTVSILQLRSYDDDAFNRRADQVRDFFRVLRTFTLDAEVRSVAIADLEGDGENDLIVTTTASTYAIGLKVAQPFGAIAPEQAAYCPGSDVKVRWNRRVGGGQNGVRLVLMHGSDPVRTLAYRHLPAAVDPLNPGIGPDSLTFSTAGLAPGTYRLRIEDTVVTSASDISNPFVIEQPAIDNFTADAGANPRIGDMVHLAANVTCADSVHVLRSYDGSTWETAGVYRTITADSADATLRIDCPPAARCGGAESLEIRFALVHPASGAASDTVRVNVALPLRDVALDDPASQARRRTIRWSASDYDCTELMVTLITKQGTEVPLASGIPVKQEEFSFEVPDPIFDTLRVKMCCAEGSGTSCTYGLSGVFEIPELPPGNYVAPNPFNPAAATPAGGALVVYRLDEPSVVSVTIYDASRAVVRRLQEATPQNPGRHRIVWDGRNALGDIVGAGTYICIVERGSGQPIILPVIVTKR